MTHWVLPHWILTHWILNHCTLSHWTLTHRKLTYNALITNFETLKKNEIWHVGQTEFDTLNSVIKKRSTSLKFEEVEYLGCFMKTPIIESL